MKTTLKESIMKDQALETTAIINDCRARLLDRQQEVNNWRANDGGLTWAAADELSDIQVALKHLDMNDRPATREWLGEDWEDMFTWSEPLSILAEWAFN